jgi:hypothetical protein
MAAGRARRRPQEATVTAPSSRWVFAAFACLAVHCSDPKPQTVRPIEATIVFPPGAVTSDFVVSISEVGAPADVTGAAVVGAAIQLEPGGKVFEQAVEITLSLSAVGLPAGTSADSVVIMRSDADGTDVMPIPSRTAGPGLVAGVLARRAAPGRRRAGMWRPQLRRRRRRDLRLVPPRLRPVFLDAAADLRGSRLRRHRGLHELPLRLRVRRPLRRRRLHERGHVLGGAGARGLHLSAHVDRHAV